MNNKHPLHYLLPACGAIALASALWIGTGSSLQSVTFWQLAALLLLISIGILSIALFRNVSRLYPLLRFGSSSSH